MTNLAIIGVGALGSRHLQALSRLQAEIQVVLVDPFPAAREQGLQRLAEAGGVRGEVRQAQSLDELDGAPDVAIVATNSRERLPVLQALCRMGCKSVILEKVLFTRPEEYEQAALAIRESGADVWVNCVRRTAPRFHRLLELVSGRPSAYRVEGHDWGLACNVVHHLDEWSILSGLSDAALSPDLTPGATPSKRAGYFEVSGTLNGVSGASVFSATSLQGVGPSAPGDRTVTITCEDMTLTMGQSAQELTISRGGRLLARETYPQAMQSEATAWHVTTILAGGEPAIPRFASAAGLHLALLEALTPHFQSIQPGLTECPIT